VQDLQVNQLTDDVIPNLLSDEMNAMLTTLPTDESITSRF